MARPSFPKTLREFQAKFGSEEACQQYLASCRWPEGFACLRCGNRRAYELARQRHWQCAACGRQVSLTAKTILHNTKTPLTAWFWAAYLMTTDKRGGFGATFTAPAWPATIRNGVDDAPQISASYGQPRTRSATGEVEVDETWVGGTQTGLRGSRQLKGRKAFEIRYDRHTDASRSAAAFLHSHEDQCSTTLTAFLKQNVAPGSTVYTDGLKSFTGLQEAGFKHVPRSQPLRIDLRKDNVLKVQQKGRSW